MLFDEISKKITGSKYFSNSSKSWPMYSVESSCCVSMFCSSSCRLTEGSLLIFMSFRLASNNAEFASILSIPSDSSADNASSEMAKLENAMYLALS
ncbi:hypothetical protein D3C85_1315680 [compost metagenome]